MRRACFSHECAWKRVSRLTPVLRAYLQVGFAASLCWTVDVILFAADQHQMDSHAEPRELPEIKGTTQAESEVQVEWVEDRDASTGRTSRWRSKSIWISEYSAGKERDRMHRTANW